ncbi:MAG TPA: hypothetical protein VK859_17425 [bacterium]|nr:hypothetical protein [bacterium]
MFYLLGLLGGMVMIFLDSVYFKFALPKLENFKNGELAVGAIIWYCGIIIFAYFPYTDYCVHTVLNSNETLGSSWSSPEKWTPKMSVEY